MVIKSVKRFSEKSLPTEQLLPLYRDTDEDKKFVKDLLKKVVGNDKENSQ